MMKLVFFVIVIQLALAATIPDDLVITLPDGKVQGAAYFTPTNVTYYGWRGIPYATPPVGDLRFDAPKPAQSWSGVLDATEDSRACISAYYHRDTESEDCLYINIYTASLQPTEKLPVMFFIYGGGFTTGYSSKSLYGPDFLVEEDVIMVSFNYRLGAFGFLSTQDKAIHGNAGLKDQNLAMKWTYDNIEFFGGDPEKITIFGQSAGGASTGLHLVSGKSSGLFRAAIVESGSAVNSFAIDSNPISLAFLLADTIGGGDYGNDTQKLKEFLLEKSTEEIMNASNVLSLTGRFQTLPTLEAEDEDAFITESPYGLLESGRFNKVPIVIGICAEESLMFLRTLNNTILTAAALDSTPEGLIPSDLRPNSSDIEAVIEAIQNTYLAKGELFSNNLVAVADFNTDTMIARGVIKHAQLTSNYTSVYLYQFAYYGRVIIPAFIDGAEKAGHSAELPFLFNTFGFSETIYPSDLATQNTIVKLWTNFAKYLNPTPDTSELIWPTISPNNLTYLNINDTVEVRPNLKGNTYPQWDKIYQTYGKRPFITY